jgi:integrase
MRVSEAINQFLAYHRANSKPSTIKSYEHLLMDFQGMFGDKDVKEIISSNVFGFLGPRTESLKQGTKNDMFSMLKSFFNFCMNMLQTAEMNPCNTLLLRKAFRNPQPGRRVILSKEVMDEIIFRTSKLRDRLFLELQARSGLRIGEALRLRVRDIDNRKLDLYAPKSGRDSEEGYMPESLAVRLNSYIQEKDLQPDDRVFPLSYSGGRRIVTKAGERVGVALRPHDLRRHSATYASRSGMPLEVISKMILRHQNLVTTQRYLGKISGAEALHWMDRVHGV